MVERSEERWRRGDGRGRGAARGEGARGVLRAQRKDASGDVIAIDALRSATQLHRGERLLLRLKHLSNYFQRGKNGNSARLTSGGPRLACFILREPSAERSEGDR